MRLAGVLMLGLIMMSGAKAEPEHYAKAKMLVDNFLAEYDSREAAREATRVDFTLRTSLCSYCHGADGISSNPEVPSLAGQNPVYLAEQLLNFNTDVRKLKVMHDLAKEMEEPEIALIAFHYSEMHPGNPPVDAVLADAGKAPYTELCASCHGAQGDGAGLVYARLSGQHPDYLYQSLTKFADSDSGRDSATMHMVSKKLSLLQMKAVAHYVAGLK